MKKELRDYFKKLGSKGGKVKSEAKTKAARANIKLRWLKEKGAKLAFLIITIGFSTGCQSLNKLIDTEKGSDFAIGSTQEDGDITLLIAGQSNAVAMATQGETTYSTTGMVVLVDSDSGVETIPTQASPASTSLTWIHLGDKLASRTGRRVRIINVAIGSTDSTQWATMYASRISDAIARFQPNAVLWVQGEHDTHNGFSTETTYQNLKAIIGHASGVPFYVALDGFMPGMDREPVRTAQNRVINEGLALRGPDIDALRTPSNMEWTGIHFSGQGFDAHAQAWFEILKNFF